MVIGTSGSGNSENVQRAVLLANMRGATTVGFTGYDGGKLARLVDVNVLAPGAAMAHTEDVHMVLDHLIATVLRGMLEERFASL